MHATLRDSAMIYLSLLSTVNVEHSHGSPGTHRSRMDIVELLRNVVICKVIAGDHSGPLFPIVPLGSQSGIQLADRGPPVLCAFMIMMSVQVVEE